MNPDSVDHLREHQVPWSPPSPIAQLRWEYLAVQMPSSAYAIDLTRELNHWGEMGWEMCGTEYGCFIFKRPMKETNDGN